MHIRVLRYTAPSCLQGARQGEEEAGRQGLSGREHCLLAPAGFKKQSRRAVGGFNRMTRLPPTDLFLNFSNVLQKDGLLSFKTCVSSTNYIKDARNRKIVNTGWGR